ncbi:hypothetical protein NM208_g14447 [Fusarium decemcellulare]|uniref:Uncharacterized protein n=1 Tax=Fusarium decemcellulare TaxID=57161 RepID=A0ACC1RG29_9HYPO|nr:hypothetical protein NM208_g14447 [Fusarium decemcellulare]
MPLLEMSSNIQETEAMGRKRSHDEFEGDSVKVGESDEANLPLAASSQPNGECALPSIAVTGSQSTPQGSPDLTEPGSSTPVRKSPSPHTPVKNETTQDTTASASKLTANPPLKKKKPTPAEKEAKKAEKEAQKEAKEKEAARLKEEREEKAAIRAVERAKADAEKAARAKEREEKAKEREEKRRQKEEEKKRKEDEEEKKARQQRTLGSFFKVPSTPKKSEDATKAKSVTLGDGSPAKIATRASKSEYEKLFKPFFVKEHTRVARLWPEMDDETRELKSKILDECIGGQRAHELQTSFDPVRLFALPGKPPKRGKLHHPVRHIMEHVYKETEKSDNAIPEHADKIMREARQKLSRVPMKVIAFSQDVRPPYYGTMTFKPFALGKGNMSQLARRPTGKRLPLDYDYDSEAEWQEEEGEDLDADDDEEELDDEDDMEGFLDDSEDAGLSRRIFANTMEPDSTGICFEDGTLPVNQVVYEHRMEFMHDGLEQTWGIDPFSTQYWEPETKTKTAKVAKTTKTSKVTQAAESGAKMPPPPPPANAFAAMTGGASTADAPKLVKSELMDDVKRAILDHKSLSKVGIIDFVFHQFRNDVSRTEVKNTIELVAEKTGKGRSKEWALKHGHEITS